MRLLWSALAAILVLCLSSACHARIRKLQKTVFSRMKRSTNSLSGFKSISFVSKNSKPDLYYPSVKGQRVSMGRDFSDGIPIPSQTIRLRAEVVDANPNEGRVEVFSRGQYGLITDDYWDKADADVACKQLGFVKGAWRFPRSSAFGVPSYMSSADITIGSLRCQGTETKVQDCPHDPFPIGSKKKISGVICNYNDGCPYGWSAFEGMCYRVVSTSKTFEGAERHCKTLKANLMYIQNARENHFVSDMLHLKFKNVTSAWTSGLWNEFVKGANQSFGAWIWNGTVRKMSPEVAKLWFPGFYSWRKNRRPQFDFRQKSCVALNRIFIDFDRREKPTDVGYFWLDNVSCKQRLPFVCQRSSFASDFVANSCYYGDGSNYRGTVSRTDFGTYCESWATPFSTINPDTHPFKGLGDHNNCRNPDSDIKPWCWIDAGRSLYGYCALARCTSNSLLPRPTESAYKPPKPGFGNGRCGKEEFLCPSMLGYNKGCFNKAFVCDGIQDCHGGEDEAVNFCRAYLCSASEFFCAKDNLCIRKDHLCDHLPDCSDASDERNCTNMASVLDRFEAMPNMEMLWNKMNYGWLNVTAEKCAELCSRSARVGFTCLSFDFRPVRLPDSFISSCTLYEANRNSPVSRTILQKKDGIIHYEFRRDCGMRSDFRCLNGRCIVSQSLCNAVDDCGDRSDERGCPTAAPIPFKLHLAGGRNKWEGRVEIRYKGEWGLVCANGFDQKDADVACREIGYPGAAQIVNFARDLFGIGNWNFLMDEVACKGNEKSLQDCKHKGWRSHDCTGSDVAGVKCNVDRACTANEFRCDSVPHCVHIKDVCNGKKDCSDGSDEKSCDIRLKLIGGPSPKHGTVRILRNSLEGTICDDIFDDKDAQVVCRMLGYTGRAKVSRIGFGPGPGVVWLDDLMCRGTERSLADCPGVMWGESDCTHNEDVAVECDVPEAVTTPTPTPAPTSVPSATKEPTAKPTAPPQPTTTVRPAPACGMAPLRRGWTPRVYGGRPATAGEIPWQVGIRRHNNYPAISSHYCGGNLVSNKWVVTAAHCFDVERRKDRFLLRLGDIHNSYTESHEATYDVEDIVIHPNYTGNYTKTYDYDFALMRIKTVADVGVQFTPYIQPICLPDARTQFAAGKTCLVSGWGSTRTATALAPKVLLWTEVPLMSRTDCQRLYYRYKITDRMLCAGYEAGGIDTCDGDSGGPLACKDEGKFTLWGVTSWGNGCARPNNPGVYAWPLVVSKWIQETMAREYKP